MWLPFFICPRSILHQFAGKYVKKHPVDVSIARRRTQAPILLKGVPSGTILFFVPLLRGAWFHWPLTLAESRKYCTFSCRRRKNNQRIGPPSICPQDCIDFRHLPIGLQNTEGNSKWHSFLLHFQLFYATCTNWIEPENHNFFGLLYS